MRTRNRSDRRKPELKKETIRQLDLRPLSTDELAQVAGGGYKATCCCTTMI
jgi:hypothetical protein